MRDLYVRCFMMMDASMERIIRVFMCFRMCVCVLFQPPHGNEIEIQTKKENEMKVLLTTEHSFSYSIAVCKFVITEWNGFMRAANNY